MAITGEALRQYELFESFTDEELEEIAGLCHEATFVEGERVLIEGEAAERVFEPYFTTKSQGTGLGMAISYRMVAEHGGEIVADNRPEGGARVTVRLPLTV